MRSNWSKDYFKEVLIEGLVGDFDEAVLGELFGVERRRFLAGEVEELETWSGCAGYHYEIILQVKRNNAKASKCGNGR